MKLNTEQIYQKVFEDGQITQLGRNLCKDLGIDPETLKPK